MNTIFWIFVVLLLVVLMLVFKAKEIRHKFGFLIAAVICLFLVFSFIQIYTSHKVDLTTFDGMVQATKIYFSWLGQLFENSKSTVGYAITQDWGINSSLSGK